MRDSGRGRYLHNVGKRRNSTAGGNDVLLSGSFPRRGAWPTKARRNHFRLAEPEIRANLWAPVYMSIHPRNADRHKYRRLVFIPESRERSSRSRWKR